MVIRRAELARSRFCRVCRDFHDLDEAWPAACHGHFGTVAEGGPQIISDTIEPFRSMADGKIYSSKSLYRGDLRARGLTEVGNDAQSRTPRPRDLGAERAARRQSIRDTYRQLGG